VEQAGVVQMRLLGTPSLHDPAHADQVRVERAVAGVLHPESAFAVQVTKLRGLARSAFHVFDQ
jgi:hypothetical protein